jgi:AraC-like DNA-binding protein
MPLLASPAADPAPLSCACAPLASMIASNDADAWPVIPFRIPASPSGPSPVAFDEPAPRSSFCQEAIDPGFQLYCLQRHLVLPTWSAPERRFDSRPGAPKTSEKVGRQGRPEGVWMSKAGQSTTTGPDGTDLSPPASGGSASVVHELGPVEAIHMICAGGPVQGHLERTGHDRERSYAFLLLLRGSGLVRHYGHEARIGEGDFVLINSAAPCSLKLDEPGEIILLRVAPRVLRTYLPAPEYFCGQALPAGEGISEGAAELVQSIFWQLEAGLQPEFRGRIARNLLDTLATAFSIVLDGALDGSPIICSRNARVRLYIERNLRDPDLKPSTIAANLRLSPRYLRVIFAASKETVSAYMLRRRLEECARELADPQLAHLSITEIAFGWGFNSGPHFTRSFRNRFGASPRDYRRFGLGDMAPGDCKPC